MENSNLAHSDDGNLRKNFYMQKTGACSNAAFTFSSITYDPVDIFTLALLQTKEHIKTHRMIPITLMCDEKWRKNFLRQKSEKFCKTENLAPSSGLKKQNFEKRSPDLESASKTAPEKLIISILHFSTWHTHTVEN